MAAIVFKWLALYSFWFLPSSGIETAAKHPFYVSVTEVQHNAADKTLEISSKVFADDLEQALEKAFNTSLDITTEKDKANFDKLLPAYFAKHLQFIVDGKPVKLSYVGFEQDKESAYCYFQVDGIAAVKKMDVANSILYDFIDSEINIMHITVNGTRRSTKVAYPEKNASFSF